MRLIRALCMLGVLLFITEQARAAIQAELAFGSRGAAGTWELIKVTYTPEVGHAPAQGEMVLTIRDGRGGPVVARPMESDGGGYSALTTLPLIAPGELPYPKWPVACTIECNGIAIENSRVTVAMESASLHRYRLLVPPHAKEEIPHSVSYIFQAADPGATMDVGEVSESDLLTASPLLFASADGLLITPAMEKKLTPERASALLAAGLRLICVFNQVPSESLGHFVWEHPHNPLPGAPDVEDAATTWFTAAIPQPRPVVIEPGLLHLPALAGGKSTPANVQAVILFVGPAALLALLLARGLFQNRAYVLICAAALFAGIAAGTIAFLRAGVPEDSRQASWEVMTASPTSTVGALTSTQTLTVFAPLFARHLHAAAEGGTVMAPLAASTADFFAMQNARLSLGLPGHVATELDATVPAGGTLVYSAYETTIAGVIPPLPHSSEDRKHFTEATGIDLDIGYWIDAGYVFSGDLPEDQWKEGILFTTWASRGLPELLRPAAQVWYDRRFDARRRYFVWEAASPRGEKTLLRVIDFGVVKP